MKILLDAPAAASALHVSERTFHQIRRRSDFPRDAEVRLSPRCVRFRVEALNEFATRLAAETTTLSEPEGLRHARESRKAGQT